MKKILILCSFLMFVNFTYADEDECPPAVDAADAQNHNKFKNCDYSNTGLNGVLHRALTNKDESDKSGGKSSEKSVEQTKSQFETTPKITKKDADKSDLQKSGEFNSAEQLQRTKFESVQKLARACPKGFVVEGERYLPATGEVMKLELIYHCL